MCAAKRTYAPPNWVCVDLTLAICQLCCKESPYNIKEPSVTKRLCVGKRVCVLLKGPRAAIFLILTHHVGCNDSQHPANSAHMLQMVYVLHSATCMQQMGLILPCYKCAATNFHPLQSVKGSVWHKTTKKTPCATERAHVIQSGVCAAENPIPTKPRVLSTVL